MKKWLLLGVVSWVATVASAQDSAVLPKKITANGYFKDLQTLSFNKNFDELISGNLVHNRINTKWNPSEKLTIAAEFRTRLFWGEEVKLNPEFKSLLRNENEKLDLQKTWINNSSVVLHTNVERLYVDYGNDKFKIRVGRQRVNWGIATTWNPNDIFNVYNFLDFDYEERPGIDGGNLKYFFKNSSSAELAYMPTGKTNDHVVALKYSLNKWNYDIQFITGWYIDHPTLGIGWAGYIKDAGFKGETQYFLGGKDTTGHLNMSLEGDYMFKSGWYLNAGLLFNSAGLSKPVDNWNEINLNLSSGNLMPTKWNMILTTARELTPLLSANLSAVVAPGTNLFLFFPSIRYNMATNLDVNLVWQSFFIELGDRFEAVNHRCFLRLKWSF